MRQKVANVVSGVPEFDKAVGAMAATANERALEFVKQGQQIIAKYAKEVFIGGNAAGPSWRSEAWPVPTRRTGNLMSSIGTTVIVHELGPGKYSSESGPTAKYARRVELGFHGSGQWPYFTTRAFPYMKPGLEKAKPELQMLFKKLVLEA